MVEPKKKRELRSSNFSVTVKPSELLLLREAAIEADMPLASWARTLLVQAAKAQLRTVGDGGKAQPSVSVPLAVDWSKS